MAHGKMAYIARGKCGCAVAVTIADERLDHVALTVAGWILDGLTIERLAEKEARKNLSLRCDHQSSDLRGSSKKTFFSSLFLVRSVSEEAPLDHLSLEDLAYQITEGDRVGQVFSDSRKLTPIEAVRLLIAMGSDPAFFRLDKDGNGVL